ncbi:unnamed protein product [Cladocopium goreaui]|uniref:Uncharacterized protein n=1 Tax=Cladocopium goreaui TaxID=2562237 RepID=A0A9P1D3S4_9DINO|nr:unnamed protein product [Cladocopium goreaui]
MAPLQGPPMLSLFRGLKLHVEAVFQEIAVVFSPQNYSSTQEDLDLRAKQVAWRINSGSLKSLYQKISGEEDSPREIMEIIEEETSLSITDENEDGIFNEKLQSAYL